MFDLGPEKIMMILAAVCIFLGPKELPMAARKIGAATRQLRSFQDTLRAEVSSALSLDTEPSTPSTDADDQAPPTAAPVVIHEPIPEVGDSFI
ncbi:MAG: twin-arginine translocase TatA/TatE family subunit [Acidimicrobiia bacterium]